MSRVRSVVSERVPERERRERERERGREREREREEWGEREKEDRGGGDGDEGHAGQSSSNRSNLPGICIVVKDIVIAQFGIMEIPDKQCQTCEAAISYHNF
jgi:hypothetical protein